MDERTRDPAMPRGVERTTGHLFPRRPTPQDLTTKASGVREGYGDGVVGGVRITTEGGTLEGIIT